MPDAPAEADVNRRNFLNGRWTDQKSAQASAKAEIASILVQAWPERLETAARKIEAMPGAEIFSKDPKGKLVVVLEASDVGAIGDVLTTISMLPEVLTAALVFHGTDEA